MMQYLNSIEKNPLPMMDYLPDIRETLDYIYSFTLNGRKNRMERGEAEPSLDLMWEFAEYLGHPQKEYPVIHIAGTKGKGSTANFIANTLIKAGYRVGLFTSPHLQDFSERIQVDGELIPHQVVTDRINQYHPYLDQHRDMNFFEIITGLAFQYFYEQQVDIAVVEVGLGGRLDSTNIVTPILSVITSISFDHMNILGDTLEQIAFEKAGIIKDGIPVVFGQQKETVINVFRSTAQEHGAHIIPADELYKVESVQVSEDQQRFTIHSEDGMPVQLSIPLLGEHQIENATLAYAALQKCIQQGLQISIENIQEGFSTVKWPARFEILSKDPYIVIDGAHNADSIRHLMETVQSIFPERKVHVLFGVSMGKDIEKMLAELLPNVDTCLFTRSVHPRSTEPQGLVQLAGKLGYRTSYEPTAEEALLRVVQQTDENSIVLCTGSLFIAAAIRSIWLNQEQIRKSEE